MRRYVTFGVESFSEVFPEESEPLTPGVFGPDSIQSVAGLLCCANMFFLIESDTESIIVYSEVTFS